MKQKNETKIAEKFILDYIKMSNTTTKENDISNPIKMLLSDILNDLIIRTQFEFDKNSDNVNYELDGDRLLKIIRQSLIGFVNHIDEQKNDSDNGYNANESESSSSFGMC